MKLLLITAFSVGITILNQRIIEKDDIEFVTEFPCLLGRPVAELSLSANATFKTPILGWIRFQN